MGADAATLPPFALPDLHAAQLAQVLQASLPPARYAFAYGSGVMVQPGLYDQSSVGRDTAGSTSKHAAKPMLVDFILAVDDPVAWHTQNLARNPHHYAWVGQKLGAGVVQGIAEHVGVGIHFNPDVQLSGSGVAGVRAKYGVISTADMMDDLTTWRHLYVAGRLQKPVATLVHDSGVEEARSSSAAAAVATALLQLPPRFTTHDLLRQVVGLSYSGDIRVAVGAEDPHKIDRIVAGSRGLLQDMYLPVLEQRYSGYVDSCSASDEWQQDHGPAAQSQMLANHLPAALLQRVAARVWSTAPPLSHCMPGTATALDVARAAQATQHAGVLVRAALAATVRASSVRQALAGFLAEGGVLLGPRALGYVAAKFSKAWRWPGSSTVGIGAQQASRRPP